MKLPRLVVAAPHGRAGKTTVTIGLLAALAARGVAVQPFKKGPDYIDPGWLSDAAGRRCRNLDLFMMSPETALSAFRRGMEGAEIGVVEGAMGLYDGVDLEGSGSTAELARLLGAPILLVVDATRMTRSVAALVAGFQHFEPGVAVAGVVLNNVARPRHEAMLVQSIERYCGIPVLGCIPRSDSLTIPDRHLGLVPVAEDERLISAVENARRMATERLDLDRILAIACSSPEIASRESAPCRAPSPRVRIGVLLDRVFTFYYPENLEALEEAGASLVYLDSLSDRSLPDLDGLYVGGGFPELFMEQLEANESLRGDIRRRIGDGLPVYAECAGLIYLSRRVSWKGRSSEMVGALPCEIEMTDRPQGHGYVQAEVVADTPFFPRGALLRGHEFHNTRVSMLDGSRAQFAYRLRRGAGIDRDHNDGLMVANVLAAYTHLHALAVPGWAEGFVRAAEEYRRTVA
jgi:cobyrinic acid a,c-diamide synthase